jgi:5-amino-6-(5-phosphoribosylamino)uracil reductase
MSIDGYLDSVAASRLLLSNAADFDRVDDVRAGSDAILVGAATIRNDNPRLLIRSPERRADRVERGLPASPTKVTLTSSGNLSTDANFFQCGDIEKIVYCPASVDEQTRIRLSKVATLVELGARVDVRALSEDLSDRGINVLMVEGGGSIHTQFLTADLVDELQLVVAPFFVGDSRARRFVRDGRFPWTADRRATLAEVRQIGDVALLRYALSPRFDTT